MNQAHPDLPEVSKTQRKREAEALFDLGRELVDLAPKRLASIPLENDIREAIAFARSIPSHGARKRQLGYLAKLLRRTDPEPIVAALEAIRNEARQLNAGLHRAEAWRDHLLTHGDAELGRLIERHEGLDIQQMRQWIRNALRESAQSRPPASARKLFKALRELDRTTPLPELDGPS